MSTALAGHLAFKLFLRPLRRRLDAADAPWLAKGQRHRVAAGEDEIVVYEWGSGSRTVVLVHGWGSHAPRFAPLAEALVQHGWRVIAFDAPAHGRSPGNSSSLPQFIGAMDAVIKQFGPAKALIGHSLGALAIAMRLGAAGATPAPAPQHITLISMPSGAPFLIDSYFAMLEINAATAQRMMRRFEQRFAQGATHFVGATHAANIATPALLVHDRSDDIVPLAHSEEMLRVLPQARLHVTQGLGHSGLLRDAGTIAAICEDLGQ